MMQAKLTQYCGAVGISNTQPFTHELKHKKCIFTELFSQLFFQIPFFFHNSVFLFLFLAVFLILKLISRKIPIIYMYHMLLLPSLKHDQQHDYSLPLLLRGNTEFNPAPKRYVSNTF